MHVSVYVFAGHDSLGNRDSADERGQGRQVQITGVWKFVQTMLHMLSFSVLSLFVDGTNQPFRTNPKSFYNWESDFM